MADVRVTFGTDWATKPSNPIDDLRAAIVQSNVAIGAILAAPLVFPNSRFVSVMNKVKPPDHGWCACRPGALHASGGWKDWLTLPPRLLRWRSTWTEPELARVLARAEAAFSEWPTMPQSGWVTINLLREEDEAERLRIRAALRHDPYLAWLVK